MTLYVLHSGVGKYSVFHSVLSSSTSMFNVPLGGEHLNQFNQELIASDLILEWEDGLDAALHCTVVKDMVIQL